MKINWKQEDFLNEGLNLESFHRQSNVKAIKSNTLQHQTDQNNARELKFFWALEKSKFINFQTSNFLNFDFLERLCVSFDIKIRGKKVQKPIL